MLLPSATVDRQTPPVNTALPRRSRTPAPSRRRFVQTTAATATALAALPPPTFAADSAGKASPQKTLRPDVLVCGGGCAGIAAALAAARRGAKVLLIEKAPFAGGIITCVGLPYFDGIADIQDNRIVVRGIVLELLAKSGVVRPDATHTAKHNPTIGNSFAFKLLLDQLIREQRSLTVLFNSFVCAVSAAGASGAWVQAPVSQPKSDVSPGVRPPDGMGSHLTR